MAKFDRLMFRTLFTGTLIPIGLIALAFVLDAAHFSREATWRTCFLHSFWPVLAGIWWGIAVSLIATSRPLLT